MRSKSHTYFISPPVWSCVFFTLIFQLIVPWYQFCTGQVTGISIRDVIPYVGKLFIESSFLLLPFLRDLYVNFLTWCVEYLTWVSSSCLVVDAFFISSLAECSFNISVSLEVSLYGTLAFKVSLHFQLSIRWSNWL